MDFIKWPQLFTRPWSPSTMSRYGLESLETRCLLSGGPYDYDDLPPSARIGDDPAAIVGELFTDWDEDGLPDGRQPVYTKPVNGQLRSVSDPTWQRDVLIEGGQFAFENLPSGDYLLALEGQTENILLQSGTENNSVPYLPAFRSLGVRLSVPGIPQLEWSDYFGDTGVIVTNHGNVAYEGDVVLNLYLSGDRWLQTGEGGDYLAATLTVQADLLPGESRKWAAEFFIPELDLPELSLVSTHLIAELQTDEFHRIDVSGPVYLVTPPGSGSGVVIGGGGSGLVDLILKLPTPLFGPISSPAPILESIIPEDTSTTETAYWIGGRVIETYLNPDDMHHDYWNYLYGRQSLSGVTMFADLNENGIHDFGEPTDVTDEHGTYAIKVNGPGEYHLRPMLGENLGVFANSPDMRIVSVDEAAEYQTTVVRQVGYFTLWKYATWTADISNLPSPDTSSQNERPLEGWTVKLISDDGDSIQGITDANGVVTIDMVRPGQDYDIVVETPDDSWWAVEQDNAYRFRAYSGGTPHADFHFYAIPTIGEVSLSRDQIIRGQSFLITAHDVMDADSEVERVLCFLDRNNNGRFNPGDDLIGIDTDASDGWSADVDTRLLAAGEYNVIAVANDVFYNTSEVATAQTQLDIHYGFRMDVGQPLLFIHQTAGPVVLEMLDQPGWVNMGDEYPELYRLGEFLELHNVLDSSLDIEPERNGESQSALLWAVTYVEAARFGATWFNSQEEPAEVMFGEQAAAMPVNAIGSASDVRLPVLPLAERYGGSTWTLAEVINSQGSEHLMTSDIGGHHTSNEQELEDRFPSQWSPEEMVFTDYNETFTLGQMHP